MHSDDLPVCGGNTDRSQPETQILQVVRAESVAFYDRDYEGIQRHWLHDESVKVVVSGPLIGTRITSGWKQLSERMQEGIRLFPARFNFDEWIRWDNLQVQVGLDMAWVFYDQIVRKLDESMLAAPVQHETKILRLWRGEWKLVCLTISAPAISRRDVPRIELDGEGRVVSINTVAKERLKGHPGLVVSGNRAMARNRDFDQDLQAEVARIRNHQKTHLLPGLIRETVSAVPLGANDYGKPLYCWVTLEQEKIIVSFDDDFLLKARIAWAARAYALSPSQEEIAWQLASGIDPIEIASRRDVSINTVRTHLRRMFEKTGTSNQVAFISALLSVQRPL